MNDCMQLCTANASQAGPRLFWRVCILSQTEESCNDNGGRPSEVMNHGCRCDGLYVV